MLSNHTSKLRQIAPLGLAHKHLAIAGKVAERIAAIQLLGGRKAPPAALAEELEVAIA